MAQTATLAFPPFSGMVRRLIVINVVVYFAMLLLARGEVLGEIFRTFGLVPVSVVHGRVWQLFTYAFLHAGISHILFNMLALWMFGSALEEYWGGRRFAEFFFWCAVGAAIITVFLAYTIGGFLSLSRVIPTVGASGGIYGVLLAFGMLFPDRQIFMFPWPFAIRAKYLVAILILIALAASLSGPSGTANVAHLGGALFGYFYLKLLPGRGLRFATSESYYGVRNAWHRWKRRQETRKFQAYMRKHKDDRIRLVDDRETRKPDDNDKKNGGGGPGGWIN
jgi:membrane associated rhomboid family serine protease